MECLKALLGKLVVLALFIKKHSLWLCFFILPVQAWEPFLGPSYHFFNYHESDDSGRTLNRETGYLFGINGGVKLEKEFSEYGIYLRWLGGRVDYRGQTQLGGSLSTYTDQRIVRTGVSYVREIKTPLMVEFGIERNYWRRDIESIGSVQGLIEDYHWFLANLGVGMNSASTRLSLGMNAQFGAYMDVRKTVCTDQLRVFPKEEVGFYLRWMKYQQKHFGFQASWQAQFEQWGMQRSNSITADACGIPIKVHEPDNQTQLFSISYLLLF